LYRERPIAYRHPRRPLLKWWRKSWQSERSTNSEP
jgi:hypothetical protein